MADRPGDDLRGLSGESIHQGMRDRRSQLRAGYREVERREKERARRALERHEALKAWVAKWREGQADAEATLAALESILEEPL